MKKLIFILLLIPAFAFSQGRNYHYEKFVTADTITADTGYQVVMSDDYSWLLFGTAASTASSTSTVSIQVSGNNGTDWIDVPGQTADTLDASSNTWGFQGQYSPGGKYRVYFDIATSDTLIVNAWWNLKKK